MKSLVFAVVITAAAALGVSAQQAQVYEPGPGITNPEVIKDAKPSYTAEAMRAKIQGSVELEGIVGVDGKLHDVRIIRSLDKVHGLDKKAIEAVEKWVFRPGRREGKPVPVRVSIELTFTLRDRAVFDKTDKAVTPPVIVLEKKPAYTPDAMRRRVEGAVELEGIVGVDGKVTDARVVKGLDPDLDAKAIEAFTASTFKPAVHLGRPVPYRVAMLFTFTLRN